MYYIYDTRYPNEPFMFQDQDLGTQEPAIFDTEAKATLMCHMMNTVHRTDVFAVAQR